MRFFAAHHPLLDKAEYSRLGPHLLRKLPAARLMWWLSTPVVILIHVSQHATRAPE